MMLRIIQRLFLLHLCIIGNSSAISAPNGTPTPVAASRSNPYDRFIQKIYNNADTNHDGSIAFEEAYVMVLKLYIEINRQAPINPPSRSKVQRLFNLSDKNRNNRIQRDEFTQLANLLARRALARIVTCKMISLVGAPIVANYLVEVLSEQEWLPQLAESIVPEPLLPTVTSPAFGRTVLIVIFLQTLGKTVMNTVNILLDWALPRETGDV